MALRAGVSRTTVSFVLNDVRDKGISETTRQKVLDAASDLGYQPNAAAHPDDELRPTQAPAEHAYHF